mmetsp:Transcript_63779/g.151005  ORF Transcript_63779/g.151005 Transcript_63779/m.151005 type:complete len:380 (+) Transcript_63779:589-1728(+)
MHAAARGARRGAPAGRERYHHLGFVRDGNVHRSRDDGIRAHVLRIRTLLLHPCADVVEIARRVLDLVDDPLLHHHRLQWVPARSRLGREHDRVRAIEDRVGYVARLSAGRDGAVDHALEHLCRHDHRLALPTALSDDIALDDGHPLDRHLHTQVPPRHHAAVRRGDDCGEILDSRWLLDLRHDPGAAINKLPQLLHILSALHETQSHPVDVHIQRVHQIFAVLGCQRRDGEDDRGGIDALAVGELAPDVDSARHLLCRRRLDGHAELAIVEQNLITLLERPQDLWVRQAHPRLVAGRAFIEIEGEILAVLEHYHGILESRHAELRALEVRENADRMPVPRLEATDDLDKLALLLGVAVREVEAEHVYPRPEQRLEHLHR